LSPANFRPSLRDYQVPLASVRTVVVAKLAFSLQTGVPNFFKKVLARRRAFDIFTTPLRPKGRKDSMFADR
jgi:hypothetical protein